jgi:hypothetical protein
MPRHRDDFHLSKREVTKLIYVSGHRPNYTVRVNGFGDLDDFDTSSIGLGNYIVWSLREIARVNPELFPAAVRPTRTSRRNRGASADA